MNYSKINKVAYVNNNFTFQKTRSGFIFTKPNKRFVVDFIDGLIPDEVEGYITNSQERKYL